jgi:histone-lysine N-methyltransferase SETMAR
MSGIPRSTAWKILKVNLRMRRLVSYWVPQRLTPAQKIQRIEAAQSIRQQLVDMGEMRYTHYVVEDETWVNFDTHQTATSSKSWVGVQEPRPQAVASKLTPRKCIILVAFSACKRFSVKAMPYGETINGEVYKQFVHKTGEKWRHLKTHPVRLQDLVWQHDNARPHTKLDVVQFFQKRRVFLLHQSPYSPDLNICDRWMFSYVKKVLRERQFESSYEVLAAFTEILQAVDETLLKRQVDLLMAHCEKVIEANGEYVTPS